ncbi:MAG: hypothetical protein IT385_14555 [Deltaproteobacteria bacterium]|nr:hypothetical protein [Deltaproteobacteria bacterium]
MKVPALLLLALVVGLALPADEARATIVRPFSLVELTDTAHVIVRGEVIDHEVVWDPERHELYTHTTVRVLESLAGAEPVGALVVVRQIGGELDGVARRVVGTARLDLGDEVVLFARTDGAFLYMVGMAQGAFHVARAPGRPAELRRHAVPTLAAIAGPARPPAPDLLALDALRTEVSRRRAEAGR